jgi:hypothetical protein
VLLGAHSRLPMYVVLERATGENQSHWHRAAATLVLSHGGLWFVARMSPLDALEQRLLGSRQASTGRFTERLSPQ